MRYIEENVDQFQSAMSELRKLRDVLTQYGVPDDVAVNVTFDAYDLGFGRYAAIEAAANRD